jgi:hypothetical protein
MRFKHKFFALLAACLALVWPGSGMAANVFGVLIAGDAKPAEQRQLHFENRISQTSILVQTARDGSFATELPPGTYDLRREDGTVVVSGIEVHHLGMDLGPIPEPSSADASMALQEIFNQEVLKTTLINSPAPSTANLPDVASGELTKGFVARSPAEASAARSDRVSPKATFSPLRKSSLKDLTLP